ncbi:hypothetical protein [Nocardia carnea]|nr:hypothetical protein [Nocardia carnea]
MRFLSFHRRRPSGGAVGVLTGVAEDRIVVVAAPRAGAAILAALREAHP